MTDPAAPRELTYQERATLQDLYAWSDRLTDDWLGLGERLRGYADAWKADVDELRAEVERLTKERAAYRSLAGIGFSGTDEADELAALPPLVRDQEAFRRKQGRQSGLIGSAPHCPTCGCGSEVPRTPAP